jgi:hypothetical protein
MIDAHECAKLFPLATESELEELTDDIAKRGLSNAIILHEGKILDGRNRYEACRRAGVEPFFRKYEGDDPLADVLSWNLYRRQLTTSQRAAISLTLKPMFEKQAKERQGRRTDLPANLPEGLGAGRESRDDAAHAVNVSPRIVHDAAFVQKHDPGLVDEIKAGKITVHAAKKQVEERAKELPAADPLYGRVDVPDIDRDEDKESDSPSLAGLKRYWHNSSKKEKKAFILWTQKEGK